MEPFAAALVIEIAHDT